MINPYYWHRHVGEEDGKKTITCINIMRDLDFALARVCCLDTFLALECTQCKQLASEHVNLKCLWRSTWYQAFVGYSLPKQEGFLKYMKILRPL